MSIPQKETKVDNNERSGEGQIIESAMEQEDGKLL